MPSKCCRNLKPRYAAAILSCDTIISLKPGRSSHFFFNRSVSPFKSLDLLLAAALENIDVNLLRRSEPSLSFFNCAKSSMAFCALAWARFLSFVNVAIRPMFPFCFFNMLENRVFFFLASTAAASSSCCCNFSCVAFNCACCRSNSATRFKFLACFPNNPLNVLFLAAFTAPSTANS